MRVDLRQLANELEAKARLAGRFNAGARDGDRPKPLLATGWIEVDQHLRGGLPRGAVHEWFDGASAQVKGGKNHAVIERDAPTRHRDWLPPLAILIHLAWQALGTEPNNQRIIVWVGPRCWPHPRALLRGGERDRTLLRQSLLVDATSDAERLWAIDLSLRCAGVAGVVSDGSGFDMAATRRLQLAAESGATAALLARPPRDFNKLSAATTRWAVRTAATVFDQPRWIVQLLRCKGLQPALNAHDAVAEWALEWDGATSAVCSSSPVADRPGAPAGTAEERFILPARHVARIPA